MSLSHRYFYNKITKRRQYAKLSRECDSLMRKGDVEGLLRKWNELQKELWNSMIMKGLVGKAEKDISMFIDFAAYFSNYFSKRKKPPSLQETIKMHPWKGVKV